uniref:Uncharacterized protein n=1 Tax=Gopherus agassizii TaxID=38772 RepID=A0A452HM11_9SAUR
VNFPSVPSSWAANSSGAPALCHVCRGSGEALRVWQGEAYCHLGRYRCFGDLPLYNCHGDALKGCPPGTKRLHAYVEPDTAPEGSPTPKKRRLTVLGAWLPGGLPRPERAPRN